MINQVTAILYFDSHDEAVDFYHDCQLAYAKATKINPGNPEEECSIIELILNHHDRSPTIPCELVDSQNNGTPP